MIQSKHLTRAELLELLNDEADTEKTRAIGEHLHQCETCRAELDSISARSEIWAKTPELLKNSFESGFRFQFDPQIRERDQLETQEHSPSGTAEEPVDSYSVEGLLEPPKHPEMMGRIGRYDIEREVGRGGMGVVFKAHDSELNRPLAIKILAPHLACHGTARKRFAQEARAAAAVLHPNIIAVHDVSNEGKTPYIVMPYIAGYSLQALVDENGPFEEIEITRVALQIAAGLVPAHAQGLVHRDIKPANILVEQGCNRVVITDFGLARAEDDASLTRTGWLTGTPNYMSPEQARGDRLDQRSDLFSLGSLIYFLSTGRLPFRAESPLGVLTRIQNQEPTPVRQVNRKISQTLSDVIEVLLRKDPKVRLQSAAQLHEILEAHLTYLHQPDVGSPPVVIPRPKKWTGRFGKGGLVASVLVGVPLAASMIWMMNSKLNQLDQNPLVLNPTIENSTPGILQGDASDSLLGQPMKVEIPEIGALAVVEPSPVNFVGDDDKTELGWNWGDGWANFGVDGNPWGGSGSIQVFSNIHHWESEEGKKQFEEGYEHLVEKRFGEAIDAFAEAAQFERFEQEATYNIGCCYALQGESDKALKYLHQAVALGFNCHEQYSEDEDLASLQDDERFETLLKQLKTIEQADELVAKAKSMVDAEDFEDAVEFCQEALKLHPENEEAWLNLGYALHMQGDVQEAMKWHQKAAASTSVQALGNYNVCCVHAINDETDLAFEYLDKAIEAGLAQRLGADYLMSDEDLENIRSDKRFKKYYNEVKTLQHQIRGFRIRNLGSDGDFMGMMTRQLGKIQEMKGEWEGHLIRDEFRLTMTESVEDKDWDWGYSTSFSTSDFSPSLTRESENFRLERPYGALVFKGDFDGRHGTGEFSFEGEEKFQSWMKERGINDAPEAVLFRLFMSFEDEDKIVENLKSLQELNVEKETLHLLMVHGVEAKDVRKYQKSDLDIKEHLQLIVNRVPARLVKDYVGAGIDVKKYQQFLNQRVPAELLRNYQEAGFDLEENKKYIGWRVGTELLKEYKKAGLDLEEHAGFINRRVGAKLLQRYAAAGLDLAEHDRFINQRVEPKFLKSYKNAGFELAEHGFFIQHRVPVKLLKEYQEAKLDIHEHKDFIQKRMEPSKVIEYLKRREDD